MRVMGMLPVDCACGARRDTSQMLCSECMAKLPAELRSRVYWLNSPGFPEAFQEALRVLGLAA